MAPNQNSSVPDGMEKKKILNGFVCGVQKDASSSLHLDTDIFEQRHNHVFFLIVQQVTLVSFREA